MRLRGSGDQVPAELLRYRAEDWSTAAELAQPAPAWWDHRYCYGEHEAIARWSAARRAWLRTHARTIAEMSRLYGPGVVFPPDVDPRAERRIALALHPTLAGTVQ